MNGPPIYACVRGCMALWMNMFMLLLLQLAAVSDDDPV